MSEYYESFEKPGLFRARQRVSGPVVAAVVPGQPEIVVQQAADLAYSLGVDVVFAYVDVTRYLVEDGNGGDDQSAPIDPDGAEDPDDAEGTSRSLRTSVAQKMGSAEVKWTFVTLAGEPARSLGRLAKDVKACMIVVGTRERGVGARLEKLLVGSIAVHLTHRQLCPVLVVPLAPASAKGGSR